MLNNSIDNATAETIQEEENTDFGYPLPRYVYTLLGMALSITFSIGFVMNLTVILCFLKFKNLRSITNTFILSLAINDFLMSAMGTPLAMTSNYAGRWLWGKIGCTYEGFMVYFLGLSQMYNLAAISMDRYFVIAKPLLAPKITHRVAVMASSCCWLGGLFWTILPILGWNRYAQDVHGTSCTVVLVDPSDPGVASYNTVIFFTCLLLPLGFIVYGYYGVFMTLRSVTRSGVWDLKSRVARKNLKIEKKMAKTIAIMLGVYIGSWTPYTVVHFWSAFGDASTIPTVASAVAAITAKSSAIWNPMVYFGTNKMFRIAFYKLLPCSGLTQSLVEKEERQQEESDGNDDEKTKAGDNTITVVAPAPPAATTNNTLAIPEESATEVTEVNK